MALLVSNGTVPTDYRPERQGRAEEAFRETYPDFGPTAVLDRLRADDYGRLDDTGHIYLDYTGGGLYARSQLRRHMALLESNVFGNPHSNNPTSMAMTDLVEATRRSILRAFNASPDDYTVIFTSNASGALKHIGESYPFGSGGRYLLTFDNHNSVNGIREFARARGAAVVYAPLTMPDLRIDRDKLAGELDRADPAADNLFAFPAQSNFSGVQHPLELVGEARRKGWDVLVDAAAFAPTNRLDIGRCQPDFVSLSFYKMFGYPTGIGALIARKEKLARLQRPWFAGGTIVVATVQGQRHQLAQNEAAFEDGTIDYLNIPAVDIGLRHLAQVGIDLIHDRVTCLTGWLLNNLMALRHGNGRPLARIYGPVTTEMRGGTVTFNLYDKNGRMFDYRRVEELAGERGISLRTGCFCNPGVNEMAEGLTEGELDALFEDGRELSYAHYIAMIEEQSGKSAGAVRASVGLVTNFADVYSFMGFIHSFVDQTTEKVGPVAFDIEGCRVLRDGS